MDMNDLRSVATVLCFIALVGIFFWAYHPKRKNRFEADGQLPFVDDAPVDPLKKMTSSEIPEEKSQ
jgi:cytochrome c oxidase cbb3-type subunit 4